MLIIVVGSMISISNVQLHEDYKQKANFQSKNVTKSSLLFLDGKVSSNLVPASGVLKPTFAPLDPLSENQPLKKS